MVVELDIQKGLTSIKSYGKIASLLETFASLDTFWIARASHPVENSREALNYWHLTLGQ